MLSNSELPAMTAAEMRAQREFLGLSAGYVARKFVLDPKRYVRMEAGAAPIPDAVMTYLDELAEYTKDIAHRLTATLRRKVKSTPNGYNVPVLTYYDGPTEYNFHGEELPASWHRMLMQRVSEAVPGLVLTYNVDENGDPCVLPAGASHAGKMVKREDKTVAQTAG